MAERRKKLWQRRELWVGCLAFGLGLGATCPLWPAEQRHVCHRVSDGLRHVGLTMLGLPSSPAAVPDAGVP